MSLIQLVEEIIQPLLKEIAIVGADGVIKGEPSRKKVKKNKTNSMSGYKKIDDVIQPSKAYGFYKLEKGKKVIQFKGSKSAARSELKKARKKDLA